jgi:hypothetical protein
MLSDHDEAFPRAAFAPVRDIEPDEDLVARVVARASRRKRASRRSAPALARPRLALQALAALALLGVALYAVPATRAAIEGAGEGVGGVFSGWLGGDHAEAPGKPLEAGEKLPEYMEYLHDSKEPRVLAEAGGYKLYSYIGSTGGLNFELGGTGVGMGFESAAELGDAPLHLLDSGARSHADAQGHVPMFGIATRSVSSVELTYESGPPVRVSGVEGGFVLLAEPSRGPIEVIALDAGGRELGREPIDYPLVDESPEAPPPGIEGSGHASSGSHEP